MKIIGYLLALLLVPATALASPVPHDLIGDWELGAVVGYADKSTGPADANSLIGTLAHLSENDFALPRSPCPPQAPTAATTDVAKTMMDEMRSPRSDLDIRQTLLGKRATYISGKCVSAFVLKDKTLVVFTPNGAMYRARR